MLFDYGEKRLPWPAPTGTIRGAIIGAIGAVGITCTIGGMGITAITTIGVIGTIVITVPSSFALITTIIAAGSGLFAFTRMLDSLWEERRMTRMYLVCVCLLLLCWQSALTWSGETSLVFQKQQGQKKDKEDPNLLSMEIQALETLYTLKATVPQMKWIAQAAKRTKANLEALDPAKVGADYVNVLKSLRVALIANNDEEIDKLHEQLEKIAEKTPPDLDDAFDLTDAARREAEVFYKMLSLRQMITYADSFGDDLPGPIETIRSGLEATQMLKGMEWDEAREDIAEEVGWLVGGLDRSKTTKLRNDVSGFLNRQHGKSFKPGELEPKIRQIIGTPDPLTVLRNLLKHDLALLLSNPQLEKAVQGMLEKRKEQAATSGKS